jgi:hypothetical protein
MHTRVLHKHGGTKQGEPHVSVSLPCKHNVPEAARTSLFYALVVAGLLALPLLRSKTTQIKES